MPSIIVSGYTRQLILARARSPLSNGGSSIRLADGMWCVPIDDRVAAAIEVARLPSETDDQVVSRLVRRAIGRLPN